MTTSAFTPTGDYVAQVLGPSHSDEVLGFLARDVTRNLFMLSWLDNYGMAAPGQPDLFQFAGVRVNGRLVAISLVITGKLALLDASDPHAVTCLGRWYRQCRQRFEHIVSARNVVTPFWEAYSDAGRYAQARLDRPQQLLVLERQRWSTLADERAGHTRSGLRQATRLDTDAIYLASAKMHAEETLEDPLERDANHFRRHVVHRIESDRTWAWFDDYRRLLFKADVSAQSRFGAQVSGVFTPASLRGRGIATRAMTDLAEALFRRGYPRITLYVNEENAAALRVYEKVGFRLDCLYETIFVQELN